MPTIRLCALFLLSCVAACAPSDTRDAERTPAPALDWVSLPGGCFDMGEANAYPEEAPVHQACVSAFDITRHEVTNAQFAAFVSETAYVTRAERGWKAGEPGGPGVAVAPGSAMFEPPSRVNFRLANWWRLVDGASWRRPTGPDGDDAAPDWPVVHVTREDAEAYASWVGGRLPTEAEWEYAARGDAAQSIVTWDDAEREALQVKANTWQGVFPVADTASDGFAGIAPVGRFPANGFGLHDMIGNVWEWTATPYAPGHSETDRLRAGTDGFDPRQPGVPLGVVKGGSFLCAPNYCYRFRIAARQAQDLAFGTSHIGFRIVRDVRE